MPGSESQSPSPEPKDTKSGDRNGRGAGVLPRGFTDFLAWLITVAWAASFVIDIVRPTYDPPGVLHALMLTVAGAAFGTTFIRRNGGE